MSININSEDNSSHSSLLFIGFNQDYGCFAVGSKRGFSIFNTDPLKLKEQLDFPDASEAGVGRVEMLFRTNYLGILGGGPHPVFPSTKCRIWDDIKRKFVVEFEYSEDILDIKLRRDRIIIVMEKIVKVYTFDALPKLLCQLPTGFNPAGICALSQQTNKPYFAYPGNATGQVTIVNVLDGIDSAGGVENSSLTFSAHNNDLRCMVMDIKADLLATASSKGTLIRIFSTATADQIYELRRGVNNAFIYSISFSQDSKMVSVSSNHDTIHIFKLDQCVNSAQTQKSQGVLKYFNSDVSEIKINLSRKSKAIAAFSLSNDQNLIILDANGNYAKYALPDSSVNGQARREQFVDFVEYNEDRDPV